MTGCMGFASRDVRKKQKGKRNRWSKKGEILRTAESEIWECPVRSSGKQEGKWEGAGGGGERPGLVSGCPLGRSGGGEGLGKSPWAKFAHQSNPIPSGKELPSRSYCSYCLYEFPRAAVTNRWSGEAAISGLSPASGAAGDPRLRASALQSLLPLSHGLLPSVSLNKTNSEGFSSTAERKGTSGCPPESLITACSSGHVISNMLNL